MGSERTGRQIGFDALRIIAAFLVICQHVEYYWGDVIIRPISRIAVFLFFLISGYFLWDEDTNLIRNRCHKSISKLCKIYLWAILIYGIEALCVAIHTGTYDVFHVGLWKIFVFVTACTSPLFPYGYHLWFLIALIESLVVIWVISKKYNLYTNKYSGELCIVFSIIGVWVNHYIVTMPMQKIILLAMPTIILGGNTAKRDKREQDTYGASNLHLLNGFSL